jgi:hypothetical protein
MKKFYLAIFAIAALFAVTSQPAYASSELDAVLNILSPVEDIAVSRVPPVPPGACVNGGACVLGQKCTNSHGEKCICDNRTVKPFDPIFFCSAVNGS